MATLSARSLANLELVHPDLQFLAHETIKYFDFAVICGFRNQEEQTAAFKRGDSHAPWPQSKHNVRARDLVDGQLVSVPRSEAIDCVPYPVDWNDIEQFCIMIGVFMAISKIHKIPVRFGRDFKKLKDYPHIELEG